MISEAEDHAEEDHKARKLAEARNNAENAAYQAERTLADLGEQVDDADKEQIREAVREVRSSLESEDTQEINAKAEALQSAFHAISEAMYARAQEQGGAMSGDESGTEETPERSEDDVVDAVPR